jgi:hypothetical protein
MIIDATPEMVVDPDAIRPHETIDEYLERLAAMGFIELAGPDDAIPCARCGADTPDGLCGCLRSVRRVA